MNQKNPADTFPPVLVPVDFTPSSRPAALRACEMASRRSLPVVFLHVVHEPADEPGFYARHKRSGVTRPLDKMAQDMLDGFLAELRAEQPDNKALSEATTKIVDGLPAGRIAEVADQLDAGTIVMGEHARSRMSRLLTGSVSRETRRLTTRQVVLVPESDVDVGRTQPADALAVEARS